MIWKLKSQGLIRTVQKGADILAFQLQNQSSHYMESKSMN